ncbi:SDR family NAD(P)-dependent oxidoreductase [Oceanicoccus sagamiensis]|uniref:Chitin-binding protein n=1 Tax=Oceanicoccus sagamiensis TaxID=716816 RepID=A0A1X9N5U1_9GAMM|nr:SDR family oxidoreductase [Oceanicoccus sagamiensis]ARN73458.1 chitin-binding protein [Oceanicoccus sagamiensis]
MKTVVVTGSTRGIGRGMAENFLKRGCNVVVSARNDQQVKEAVEELGKEYGAERVAGTACDVASYDDLQALWDCAVANFGTVDHWVNNAGRTLDNAPFWEADNAEIESIVATNLTGLIYANKVAMKGMAAQGNGQIWNMEGFGSNGMAQAGLAIYGATKRAVNYLNKALAKDAADSGVKICTVSPGMVLTDLLIGEYDTSSEEWQKVRKTFNILADKVETVTPWLVDNILANEKDGAKVEWLTTGKVIGRFLKNLVVKRDLFAGMDI